MENNITKVSVGISAYNEEANIENTLKSILNQTEDGFDLLEIIIISDGSTDGTVQEIKNINDDRIHVVDVLERKGKSTHLNDLYKLFKGDILVLFDADVVLSDQHVVSKLIQPLQNDHNIGLVGGNPIPRPGETFIEKAVNTSVHAYIDLRTQVRGGNNAFGCDGRILALSRKFASTVIVPATMIANDAFMFFTCITTGYKFVHVHEAKVWFRSPTNLRDHLKQNKRFIASHYRLERIFRAIVSREYQIPKMLLYKNLFKQFLRAPLHASAIFLINRYCGWQAKREEAKMDAIWPMAITTKEGIIHD